MKLVVALNIMGLSLAVGGEVLTQDIGTAGNFEVMFKDGITKEEFALGNSHFGIMEQLATSDTEKCAVYQKAYKVSNIISAKEGYKKAPNQQDVIKAQGTEEFEGVSELCSSACGILDVCPDECPSNEDIEQFCDFDIPSPYTARVLTEGNETAISFSSECGFCVDTCRSDCLAFVYGCCPCAPAKAIVIATVKDHWIANEEPDDSATENVLLELVDVDQWFGPLFQFSFVASNDENDGAYPYFTKDGIGLLFDNDLPADTKIKGSMLSLWKQPLIESEPEDRTAFLPPYDKDPLRWKYNEDLSLSEDVVYVKGDEYDTGGVVGKNAQFRIVFRDSAGWHISTPYKLGTYQAIRMADPNCQYYRFNPNVLDLDKTEAGRTYGPSKPTFNCIQAVGIQINAAATNLDLTDELSFYTAVWTNFAFEAKTWTGYN